MKVVLQTVAGIFFFASVQGAMAEESTVIDGLPPGVMIFNTGPADTNVPTTARATDPAVSDTLTISLDEGAAGQTRTQASARSPEPLEFEALEPALAPSAVAPLVDLEPGEQIIDVLVVPSVSKAPVPQPVSLLGPIEAAPAQAVPPAPLPARVDPATGRLRDTPGWTGRTDDAAGIGCFPAGACASLN